MNQNFLHSFLRFQLSNGRDLDIIVEGISMEPTLFNGDVVTIQQSDTYEVGDILVFLYKNNQLLIHRLLLVKDQRCFCKGDNALRLEDVSFDRILGKVVKKNGKKTDAVTQTQIALSYLVSKLFRKTGYQVDETKKSGIYRFYQQYINKVEDLTMKYQRNKEMDYIFLDTTFLKVFDSESNEIYFFDKMGIDILNCLEDPCTLEKLLGKFSQIHDVLPAEIRSTVKEFIAECVVKKVVLVL